MALEIISAGPLTTVQDLGRVGYAAQGFQESGACDKYALKLANLLVGNTPGQRAEKVSGGAGKQSDGENGKFAANQAESRAGAAGLEFTLKGGVIRFTEPEVIALTGADMRPELNGDPVAMFRPLHVQSGDVLTMGMAVTGLRCYLAVAGGIQVPSVMGSRSTNLKCRLGGLEGRALRDGDMLQSGENKKKTSEKGRTGFQGLRTAAVQRQGQSRSRDHEEGLKLDEEIGRWLSRSSTPYRIMGNECIVMLRTVPGPQLEAFTEEGIRTFEREIYTLTADSNRMACKLTGAAIETVNSSDIISDGIVEGSVQVASDGKPIVMLADHQTTGGYAKIGTVISTDIPALAQLKPGEKAAFKFVTPEEGIAACRREAEKLEYLRKMLEK